MTVVIVAGIIAGIVLVLIVVLVKPILYIRKRHKAKFAMPQGPLEVTDTDYRELKLSWRRPKKTHSKSSSEPLVTHYLVEKLQGNTEDWVSFPSHSTSDTYITYQVTGLEPGTQYRFRVKAKYEKCISRPLTTQQMHQTKCLSGPELRTTYTSRERAESGMGTGRPLSTEQVDQTVSPLGNETPSTAFTRTREPPKSPPLVIKGPELRTTYTSRERAESGMGTGRPLSTEQVDQAVSPLGNETPSTAFTRTREPPKSPPLVIKEHYKTVINRNIVELKNDLAPVATLDHMKMKGIGIESQHTNIEGSKDSYVMNTRILKLITMNGFEAYKIFKTILDETKQFKLLDALERTETEIEKEEIAKQQQNGTDEEQEMSDLGDQNQQQEAMEDGEAAGGSSETKV